MKNTSQRDALFLAEMGIGPLWQLRAVPQAEVEAVALAAVVEAPPEVAAPAPAAVAEPAPEPTPEPTPAPVARTHTPLSAPPYRNPPPVDEASAWDDVAVPEPAAPDVATMDWAGLRQAIAACRDCACGEGRKPVFGAGPRQARWLVVAGTPSALDEGAGQPLTGDPGKLLDNMLHAVGLSRERDVFVTPLVKCRPLNAKGGDRAPTPGEIAACRPFVERELALLNASTVLTLGQVATNGLLGRALQEPLAGARGDVHRLGEVPLVATLHPGELLLRSENKALAWADLCRARSLGPRD
ncbi:uracil-DNA glycosylase [Telluria beijingensis]|uniref:uracil-DNA glycosylase n=1 Tax=Telluria beijingensis TaxID=3068633 RepID=UPI00279535D6|nr:uracil-DNA glycosylase [Massilia sp. REN29]